MSEREKQFEPSDKLQNELKKLFSTADPVPPEVDHKIITMAARHFAGRKTTGRVVFLRWVRWAAAAAVIIVAVSFLVPLENYKEHYRGSSGKYAAAPKDVFNPAAKVTILDAFALARNIDVGTKVDMSWDRNGDGIIDKRDVDAVAFAAVRLHDGV